MRKESAGAGGYPLTPFACCGPLSVGTEKASDKKGAQVFRQAAACFARSGAKTSQIQRLTAVKSAEYHRGNGAAAAAGAWLVGSAGLASQAAALRQLERLLCIPGAAPAALHSPKRTSFFRYVLGSLAAADCACCFPPPLTGCSDAEISFTSTEKYDKFMLRFRGSGESRCPASDRLVLRLFREIPRLNKKERKK